MVGLKVALLEALASGPKTVPVLSTMTGRHRNAVRNGLLRLMDHGKVTRVLGPTEGLKPQFIYTAVRAASVSAELHAERVAWHERRNQVFLAALARAKAREAELDARRERWKKGNRQQREASA